MRIYYRKDRYTQEQIVGVVFQRLLDEGNPTTRIQEWMADGITFYDSSEEKGEYAGRSYICYPDGSDFKYVSAK